MNIIDLSLTIDNECMTCGTPWHEKVQIEQLGKLNAVGRNTSKFVLGSHTATHMDAPRHFIDDGHGIDTTALSICVGPVTCVNLKHIDVGQKVTLNDLIDINISQRMLFVFGWYKHWKTEQYYKEFPFFSEEAVDYLLDNGMELMALDTPSPDDGSAISQFNDSPNHKKLLSRNIVIVEYLTNTDQVDFSKQYELVALPLKILNADGSPARVILKEEK